MKKLKEFAKSVLVGGLLVILPLAIFLYAVVWPAIESNLFRKIPGYSMIKDIVSGFFGKKESAFSSVALVRIWGSDTLVTAFVTDKHEDGSYTVFVPTGPNPTSGNIYHLKAENVHIVDVPVQEAMRSIISCGAGSSALVTKLTDNGRPGGDSAGRGT
jgi:uncharacterized membrane protein